VSRTTLTGGSSSSAGTSDSRRYAASLAATRSHPPSMASAG
jgi:hypothetical protein